MAKFDYQLFVIGGGSGGVRAARIAATLGARVAIAESFRYGGTCVIRGCVPKKLLVYASHFADDFEDAAGFGWRVPQPSFSWPELIAAKDREISRLSGLYQDNLQRSGVTVLNGHARLIDRHTVAVDGQTFSAENILIATGGRPYLPAIEGIEHAITSNEVFDLPQMPRRVLIVGGGFIAVEFAGILHGLGAQVTLAYRGEQVLRGFDHSLRQHLHDAMVERGVRVLLHTDVTCLSRRSDGTLDAELKGESSGTEVFDAVLYATGRVPATEGLCLAEAGVTLGDKGEVKVNEWRCSSVPGIYAVGDVTDHIALTPVAIREGAAVAQALFGTNPQPVDLAVVPAAVFSQPPIGTAGLTEERALQRHGEVDVYQSTFRPMRNILAGRDERTLVKLVVDTATQKVLGAHMIGPDAPEIIQGIGIAIRMGATKAQFDAVVAIHPTAAEEFVTLKDKVTRRREV